MIQRQQEAREQRQQAEDLQSEPAPDCYEWLGSVQRNELLKGRMS